MQRSPLYWTRRGKGEREGEGMRGGGREKGRIHIGRRRKKKERHGEKEEN